MGNAYWLWQTRALLRVLNVSRLRMARMSDLLARASGGLAHNFRSTGERSTIRRTRPVWGICTDSLSMKAANQSRSPILRIPSVTFASPRTGNGLYFGGTTPF
jgi:hypothetical protein